MQNKLEAFAAANRARAAEAERRYEEASRKRLGDIVAKKLRTTMIGSVAAFEDVFGFLWGQGKHPSEMTEAEAEYDVLREEFRQRVLNLGNSQIRAAAAEVGQYTVTWDRHTLETKGDGR